MDVHDELEAWREILRAWPRVERELRALLDNCTTRLQAAGNTPTLEDVRRLQGEINAYRTLANLPQQQVAKLENEVDESKKRRTT